MSSGSVGKWWLCQLEKVRKAGREVGKRKEGEEARERGREGKVKEGRQGKR